MESKPLDNPDIIGYSGSMGEQLAIFSPACLHGPTGPGEVARIRSHALVCSSCGLYATRTQVVFGCGKEEAPTIAFVGEGPGANEDQQGVPFVGRAGKLLDDMLAAMGLKREDVYITNAVLCRPPKNRTPVSSEIDACKTLLYRQLRAVRPRMIVTLGRSAVEAVLGTKKQMNAMRGKWYDWEGIPVRCTFHPAYLLRDPAQKKVAWDDLQAIMTRLGLKQGNTAGEPDGSNSNEGS